MTTTHFEVQGMSCGGCAKSIERRLASLEGVRTVTAQYDARCADVTFDEGVVTAEAIAEAIESLGFEVTGTCAS